MTPVRWSKLGRLYTPAGVHPKLSSHAANPLAVHVDGDLFRVFFSGRDDHNRSSVGWVDVDLGACRVLDAAEEPAFTHGPEGTFYSHGVSVGCVYAAGTSAYMLFMGWRIPAGEHWCGEIGRLVLGRDLSLRLDGTGPFVALSPDDPVSLSYPWVVAGPSGFDLWYGSTTVWDAGNGEMVHVLKQMKSDDGHRFRPTGRSVPHAVGVAQAFSRPTVLRDPAGGYDMWFSYRAGDGRAYRIGRAWSADGDDWTLRLDAVGIDVSASGWDSEMIAYPFVFEHRGAAYMLYNGNGYGRTGFGLAVLER